jgi:hypothetical protein
MYKHPQCLSIFCPLPINSGSSSWGRFTTELYNGLCRFFSRLLAEIYAGATTLLDTDCLLKFYIIALEIYSNLLNFIRQSFAYLAKAWVPWQQWRQHDKPKRIFVLCLYRWFPLPYKVGESRNPGNVDEKLRCEAATFIWIHENCPEILIPQLWGFGLVGGQSVWQLNWYRLDYMKSNVWFLQFTKPQNAPLGPRFLVNQKIYYVALGMYPTLSLYLPSTFDYARKWVLG